MIVPVCYLNIRLSFSLSLTSVYFNVIIPQHVAGLRENVRCDSSDVEDKIPRSVYTCVHVWLVAYPHVDIFHSGKYEAGREQKNKEE